MQLNHMRHYHWIKLFNLIFNISMLTIRFEGEAFSLSCRSVFSTQVQIRERVVGTLPVPTSIASLVFYK